MTQQREDQCSALNADTDASCCGLFQPVLDVPEIGVAKNLSFFCNIAIDSVSCSGACATGNALSTWFGTNGRFESSIKVIWHRRVSFLIKADPHSISFFELKKFCESRCQEGSSYVGDNSCWWQLGCWFKMLVADSGIPNCTPFHNAIMMEKSSK